MVTFGGYNGAERLNDMHEYSFATSLWTKLDVSEGDVPSGRSSLISQVYGNSLFIFGGSYQHVKSSAVLATKVIMVQMS